MPVDLQLAGVNPVGYESGNATICSGRDLPWLQESPGPSVWDAWRVAYRDVIILNGNNEPEVIYNLTTHDLGNTAHFNELKMLLRQVAQAVADTP